MMILLFLLLAGQDNHPAETWLTERKAAYAAYEAGNSEAFLAGMQKISAALPLQGRTRYQLGLAYAWAGRLNDALATLESCIDGGMQINIPGDARFDALRADPKIIELMKRSDANGEKQGDASIGFTLDRPDFFPEGVAADSKSGSFYLGSIHQREIVNISSQGKAEPFVPSGRDGLLSVMGMAVDAHSRLLWACTSGIEQTRNIEEKDMGRSGVFAFSLEDGHTVRSVFLEGKHGLGDLTLDRKGGVYLSDSNGGALYWLGKDTDKLQVLVESAWFRSPQGLCFSEDERTLYVADYTFGLLTVDMGTKRVAPMKSILPISSEGIDGLLRRGSSLFAIQNGVRPARVIRFDLRGGNEIVGTQILAANLPEFDEPTLGTFVGSKLYFVANSQWGKYGKNHRPLPLEQLSVVKCMVIDVLAGSSRQDK